MKKGTYVSRAAFAKLQGETNRLKRDIWKLVMGDIMQVISTKSKYREEFERDDMFVQALKEYAKKHRENVKKLTNQKPK